MTDEQRRQALEELAEGEGALAQLLGALGDDSWRVRKQAVQRLASWPRPAEIAPALIGFLGDDGVGARNAAVEVLASLGGDALAPLLAALGRPGSHRKFVVDALGALGERAAVPALVELLGGPAREDENLRAAVCEALGQLGSAPAVAALEAEVGVGDLLGRLAALEALVGLAVPVPLAVVLPLLDQPILRPSALEAIGNAGDLEAMPYLLDGLTDRARSARTAAVTALHALHWNQDAPERRGRIEASVRAAPPAAVGALVAALQGEAPRVRRAAATLLGWGGWPEALEPLAAALLDEDAHEAASRAILAFGPFAVAPLVAVARSAGQQLRSEIFRVFPRLGAAAADARVAGLLERALADEDPLTAAAAARALGEIGGKDSLGPLFHALERDDDPVVAQGAAHALAKLGARHREEVRLLLAARGGFESRGRVGVHLCRVVGAVGRAADRPLLLGALGAGDAALRHAAASALAALGASRDTVEALIYALADEDPRVRAAAAETLGALGDREAVAPLLSAGRDPDVHVAASAARALGQLGDARAEALLTELARGPAGVVAVCATEALGKLPATGDTPALFSQALARGDSELAKAAVRALAVCAEPGAVTVLLGALDHPRWDVRRLAAQSLVPRAADPAVRTALEARAAVERDALVAEAIGAALEPCRP
jgi:HEAT repeat protein